MITTETQVSRLEELKEQFANIIAPQWKKLQSEIGEFLITAELDLGHILFRNLQTWIKSEHSIPISTQEVCVQIAKGEIEPEVAAVIPHSVAKHISKGNMPKLEDSYTIYSPDLGKPVTKKFKNFTKEERKLNIGPHGIRSISESRIEPKPFQTARASSYRVEDGQLIVIVNSLRKEITLSITPKLEEDIRSENRAKSS
ncbi:hypothetical protein LCGC14_2703020 [marine sediment metagenome]|uniref:Uncharacterized protein n=1 Tax=marine sediment metagenome TaxID=412755 RepID=A0A0F9BPE5_9ZZZZ